MKCELILSIWLLFRSQICVHFYSHNKQPFPKMIQPEIWQAMMLLKREHVGVRSQDGKSAASSVLKLQLQRIVVLLH